MRLRYPLTAGTKSFVNIKIRWKRFRGLSIWWGRCSMGTVITRLPSKLSKFLQIKPNQP